MKRKSFTLLAACSAIAIGAVAVAANVSTLHVGDARAAATPTTRRIYAVDNDKNWWSGNVYLWNCNANDGAGENVKMTLLMSDYYGGLYYADIPYVAENHKIIFRSTEWSDGQTADITLKGVNSGLDTVYWINSGTDTNGKRNYSRGTAGMSSSQLAYLLEQYDTCSDSYANGYNAYPEIDHNFYAPSSGIDSTYGVNARTGGEANGTTIGNKMAYMQAMYNAGQAA